MAKTTEKYELMYIINPNLSEEERAERHAGGDGGDG